MEIIAFFYFLHIKHKIQLFMKKILYTTIILLALMVSVSAQNTETVKLLKASDENLQHRLDRLEKMIDDLMWHERLGDIAHVDKVYMYGPPKWKEDNPTAMGAGNPVKFWSYLFFPKNLDTNKKYPLMVLPHGGVHADFTTYYTHIVRELVSQGYVVVAAEYRGSTGYGEGHYKKIDYGGLEVEDVFASKNYMLENYHFIDKTRVGIMGWSHGGLITLFNIFDHPKDYAVAERIRRLLWFRLTSRQANRDTN